VIRLAAVGDLHFGLDSSGTLRPRLEGLEDRADLLLIAGDLTKSGQPDEAAVLARELMGLPVPVVAVLGNHDFHSDAPQRVRRVMEDVGVRILEGENTVVDVGDLSVGVAGAKGFGGGFTGSSGSEFGEPEMKAFVRHSRQSAESVGRALATLPSVDVRVALLHYSPIRETLQGEPLEIYPFLGSYLLGEAVDRGAADVVFHGHAHMGTEKGVTPGGISVRNVAQPLLRTPYAVYTLERQRVAPGDVRAERAFSGSRARERNT
jgi:Icc-related predicted phosphoesterase